MLSVSMTTVDQLRVEDNAVNMPLILPSDGNQTESRKKGVSQQYPEPPHSNGSAKLSDFAEALRFTC
jgi:hypothetical protein